MSIRKINVEQIAEVVADLSIKANIFLHKDVKTFLNQSLGEETSSSGRKNLGFLIENYEYAEKKKIPICQDTGIAVVFLKIGQDVHLTGGSLSQAVNSGVSKGYKEGYLRFSVVNDPVYLRKNTQDNTPAIIYTEIVEGDRIEVMVAPKGFGSENMSRLKMMKPLSGEDAVLDFVLETVRLAGPNACPPMVVGVGIGGDFEYAAFLSKKALCRDLSVRNHDERYKNLELKILKEINKLSIGIQGLGGDVTALAVNIEHFPTHIASLPVAVNIGCHATRHASAII